MNHTHANVFTTEKPLVLYFSIEDEDFVYRGRGCALPTATARVATNSQKFEYSVYVTFLWILVLWKEVFKFFISFTNDIRFWKKIIL